MKIPVVYCRGQYNHLIKRMLTELGVETGIIKPTQITKMSIFDLNKIDAVVIGGGPQTVTGNQELEPVRDLLKCILIPALCICVGHQLLADTFGGAVKKAQNPEFGPISVYHYGGSELFKGVPSPFDAWSSHNDEIDLVPTGFNTTAYSNNCSVEAIEHKSRLLFGTQFHPEVSQTQYGKQIFRNFLSVVKK